MDRHETKKRKKRYPSNLSDGAWRYLKPHLPVLTVGRPRELSLRQVVNAILYVLKTGCQWRQLPREFPAWSAVYYYFYRWSREGTWERLNHALRSRLRQKGGRHAYSTPMWTRIPRDTGHLFHAKLDRDSTGHWTPEVAKRRVG